MNLYVSSETETQQTSKLSRSLPKWHSSTKPVRGYRAISRPEGELVCKLTVQYPSVTGFEPGCSEHKSCDLTTPSASSQPTLTKLCQLCHCIASKSQFLAHISMHCYQKCRPIFVSSRHLWKLRC